MSEEKQVQSVSYYVWITTVTDVYTESIVGRLVRRGWNVGPLGGTLSLRNDKNMATFLAFSLSRTPKSDKPEDALDQSKAIEEVKDVLKRLDVTYHSLIVVTGQPGCTWCLGNVTKELVENLSLEKKKDTN